MKTILTIIILGTLLFAFIPLSGFTRSSPRGIRAASIIKGVYTVDIEKEAVDGIPYQSLDELLAANPRIKIPEDAIVEEFNPRNTQPSLPEGIFLRLSHEGYMIKLLNNGEVTKSEK